MPIHLITVILELIAVNLGHMNRYRNLLPKRLRKVYKMVIRGLKDTSGLCLS